MGAFHASRQPAGQLTPQGSEVAAPAGSKTVPLALVAAASGSFVVYLRTMAPTVYGLDSAELATGSYVLGVVHAPGSPTFLLLGHLFTWLPLGDVGYRVNLVSVTAAAAAVGVFCAVLLRFVRDPFAALAGAWLLAFTFYFWVSAVAAELYSLHAFFLAVLIWLALRWRTEQRSWQLYLFALCFGVGLGNHLSLAIAAPGFTVLLRSEDEHRLPSLGKLAVAALWGLLGASVYAYLPLRSQAEMNYARAFDVDVATWQGFWWMVTGQMFAADMLAVPLLELPGQVALFIARLFSNFIGVVALTGIVGVVEGFRKQMDVHLGLAAIFLGHLAFVLTYDVGDTELMLVPTYLIWAIWIVLGVQAITGWVARRSAGRIAIPVGVVLFLLAAGNLALNFGRVDLSDDWSARRRGEKVFASLPAEAFYVGGWGEVPILEYLQRVENVRPDVETLNVFLSSKLQRRQLVERRLRQGRPVFIGDRVQIPGLNAIFERVADCECYRLRPQRGAPDESVPPLRD